MRSPTKRRRHLLAGLVAAALALTSCAIGGGSGGEEAGGPGAPATLRIGYQLIPNGDLIVKDQGWLEQALPDTKIIWSRFDSGGDVNTAMLSGAIDIGLAGSSPVARGLSAPLNIPYRVPWIFDVIGDNEALVVRKGITSIKELAGKRVAAPYSSTTHYSLLAALRDAGLSESQVDIVDMEPPDIQAAWQRGDIDGAYVWTPVLAELQKTGTTLITSRELAERGTLTADLAVVRNEFAERYPDVVRVWLQQQDRAVRLARSDPQAAAAAIARQLGITPEEAARQLGQLILLDGEQQRSAGYLGTPEAPGRLAETLRRTALFLHEQKKVDAVPGLDVFRNGLGTRELADAFAQ
ncbi:glycine betaine ABC transporter substrate-binding protein [Thermobispora bispora]|uniref:Substrate-binding region of ABC-type glycine betaine transport system n=1 Tax=Thermobispora bispora (strain ATCC 19993 / DSM 43833 / CBS 139.67 / JCM 10125 / KCTC 9307 / NBRC 14880 / R51) TaxID=469371 RepID=D6Y9C0_THEBD|nr:glycine betaine ABC transporter substrate-binding protein [Thermobispora bispora]ADG88040.1 Substrate-binding region of ABC-type glycine betaine transport system [Thermobispora bispora DSM 43833]